MIDSREKLEQIFALIKNCKKAIVRIDPFGNVFGTDKQFTTFNYIESDNINLDINIPYVFITTEISSFMRNTKDIKSPIIDDKYTIYMNGKSAFDINVLPNHIEYIYNFNDLFALVMEYKEKPIIYQEENFQEKNNEMLFMKADDFSRLYSFGINEEFLVTSFNSIHPANKSDRVDVIVRDCDEWSYTVEFIIYKKKDNYKLHEFIRFRKL